MNIAAPKTRKRTTYEELRPLLFSIAYRMVGSASEAEDIVQEAFLRFHDETSKGADIDSPKAWLSTVTTRLAINHLQSARVRRESYVGTWLPEPLLTDTESEVARHAETADSLSLAFLVLLESLGPVERAIFLLHDVLDYGYDEIAARGGKAPAFLRPVFGRERVLRLLLGIGKPSARLGVSDIRYAEVNGQPGALLLDPNGRPAAPSRASVLPLDGMEGRDTRLTTGRILPNQYGSSLTRDG